ncbi:MAG: cob(I)yrinic acid a,c-diamide adenosyltransferase [Desulfococcaceae bacterium]|jgi:cob(I)alamin adenosyltransferase|nr:cob(I)yrinic acid a,c-diamide adenosyltransferase [Desulfococcaceae bacterium]
MKIYTRGGDRGKTSLFSGERVPKCHERVDAYGEIDELGSVLGALTASLPEEQEGLIGEIQQIQSDLLAAGALLAASPDSPSFQPPASFGRERVERLEQAIDRMDAVLPPLRSFILPGGHMSAAWSHIARTVCRRAERRIISLNAMPEDMEEGKERSFGDHPKDIPVENIPAYINRLSDYLFVLARYCNHICGKEDINWKQ